MAGATCLAASLDDDVALILQDVLQLDEAAPRFLGSLDAGRRALPELDEEPAHKRSWTLYCLGLDPQTISLKMDCPGKWSH